jgi:glycosyltransferase involved in cell wall biosynthesis
MPSVSIVVPNYNHALYLTTRLESVFAQTYSDYEVILMDDASTDDSVSIIQSYVTHPKVTHLVINQTNSGNTFKQWNKGIALAKGEFIWIAESDDYADPQFLEKSVQLLQQSSEIGLVFCESHLINQAGAKTGNTRDWRMSHEHWQPLEQSSLFTGISFCRNFLMARCAIPNASAVVFRKSAFKNTGGADECLKMAGDWKLWFNLLLPAQGGYIAESLNYFRAHSQTVRTTREQIMKAESLYNIKCFYRQLDKLNQTNTQMLEFIFDWSFKKTIWTGKPRYSMENMRFYFKDANWKMIYFFITTKLLIVITAHIRYHWQKFA